VELEQLVHDMDAKSLLENLQLLIDQTHIIEAQYDGLRQTFNDVLESQSNALWIFDDQGALYLENSKAKNLVGLLTKVRLDKAQEYEVLFEKRSFWIAISHKADKIIVSATDITEQKRKESLATMGQMAAHLSHEIRNPIGSIALLTSSLLKRIDAVNKPTVFEIQKAIFRIERIIQATLMFSKGIEAKKSTFELAQLQQELERAVGYYSYSKEVRFDFAFPAIALQGDFELLLMVFSNFVFNAIDAIEACEREEGCVTIGYTDEELFHRFHIIDDGVMFEDISMLFEAFKSTKERGNGLGLVLSRDIIAAHEGAIEVLIEGQKGFALRLPKR